MKPAVDTETTLVADVTLAVVVKQSSTLSELTFSADWLLAITTGADAAIVVCPSALNLADIAASVVSVAAPVGSGKDAAETASVPVPAFAVTVPETGCGLRTGE